MKTTRLAVLALLFTFLLSACSFPQQKQVNPAPAPMSSAEKVVFDFAFFIGKSEKAVERETFKRGESFEGLSAWMIKHNSLSETQDDLVENFFGNWTLYQAADGAGQSALFYLKDRLGCLLERTYPNSVEYQEEEENIPETTGIMLSLSCVELPKERISPLELSFDLFGNEPFWDAELRLNTLKFRSPMGELNLGVFEYAKEGESLIFSGEHFEKGNFQGKITQAPCSDGMSDAVYAYQVELHLGDEQYEGCAKKVEALTPHQEK